MVKIVIACMYVCLVLSAGPLPPPSLEGHESCATGKLSLRNTGPGPEIGKHRTIEMGAAVAITTILGLTLDSTLSFQRGCH